MASKKKQKIAKTLRKQTKAPEKTISKALHPAAAQEEVTRFVQARDLIPGLLYLEREADSTTRFVFHWRNLVFTIIAFALLGWVLLFSAAYLHLKYRRGYDDVSYARTLMLPFNHGAFEKDRGAFYLTKAFQDLKEGDILGALNLFRNGLIRKPDDLEARLALAEIYEIAFERPQLAINLLEDGLRFLGSASESERRRYVDSTVRCATRNKFDQRVISIVEAYQVSFPLEKSNTQDLRLAYLKAVAFRNQGALEKAKSIIDRYELNRTPSGQVLTAQLVWDSGDESKAMQLLEDRLEDYLDKSILFEKLISFCKSKGFASKERYYSKLYLISEANNYLSHISYLTYLYRHDRTRLLEINRVVRNFIQNFKDDPIALKYLASVSAKNGDTENTIEALSQYRAEGHTIDDFIYRVTIIESKLRSGKIQEAIDDLLQMEKENTAPFNLEEQSMIHAIKIAAYFELHNQTYMRMELDQLLESPYFKLSRYFSIAQFFLEMNAPELALEVMDRCMEKRAENPDVSLSFVEIHLKTNDTSQLSQSAQKAISVRRLPNHLLKETYRILSSDQNLHVPDREAALSKIEAQFDSDYLFRNTTEL